MLLGDAVQGVLAHHPGNAVKAGGVTPASEDLMHPGGAHHTVAGLVVLTEPGEQTPIV